MSARIRFTVNGTSFEVGSETPADTPLVHFLRRSGGLRGTKYMCQEGSCGACIVSLSRTHPVTKQTVSCAVNSCLTPILACQGAAITTVEGLGDRHRGYSEVQAALARCGGSQCGFCSPGMVMNMYSLLKSKERISMKDVENSFGGNVCRCTGYRPILDAFKSLSADASETLKQKTADIEDIWKICKKGTGCDKCTCVLKDYVSTENKATQPAWFIPLSIEEIYEIIQEMDESNYILLAGNTARGVYKPKRKPSVLININHIASLKEYSVSEKHLVLGGNTTISETIDLFYRLGEEQPRYSHLKTLAEHLQLVANLPIRNVGTLAGNLMIKLNHPEFPSDIFLILETVNARIIIVARGKEVSIMPAAKLLENKSNKFIINKILIPALPPEYKLRTFKIMGKAENVYAHVNAGFLFPLDENYKVIGKPNIVYGGIRSDFIHARRAEEYFSGKELVDESVFRTGVSILAKEIDPIQEGFQASNKYRKVLAINLFYKFVLGLADDRVEARLRSGGKCLERPLSLGRQSFDTSKENWPLNQPINKVESIIQCSGEAEFVNDIPEAEGQLFGSLVLAARANAVISAIDPSPALEMEGVVAFYSAKDIPGENRFMVKKNIYNPDEEELFCSGRVLFAGQPVGVLVAEREELAQEAASRVRIEYAEEEVAPPLLSAPEVLSRGLDSRIVSHFDGGPTRGEREHGSSRYELRGEVKLGPQYHFFMEPHTCLCIPMEDGLRVYPASQWMSNVQEAVARVLHLPLNSINMEVRRLGGGFGGKITRASQVSAACALAAFKTRRPVRLVLDIETTMKALGKRSGTYSKYEVGFDESGLIERLNVWVYEEVGSSLNDPGYHLVRPGVYNCYQHADWKISVYSVLTDAPSSAWMRAPGTLEGLTLIEEIMEHISFTLKMDPLEVRMRNFGKEFPTLRTMASDLISDSNYHQRRKDIELFNKANRWRKRGISFLPMSFHIEYFFRFNAVVSIYADDGTVAITHGGIEMGQGVNTKAIQMCARMFGIDTKKIKVKPSSVMTSPNAHCTGASITSDGVAYSTQKCCEILNNRLKEVKDSMRGASWEEVVYAAHEKGVDLSASYLAQESELKNYKVYAAAVSEVEVDILTGQYQILRADILEDAGESMNPEIDVGQVEGGFVMGLGYFLTEKIHYDPITGLTITDNTAKYWVPGPKDIPIDFRVSLLKNSSNINGVARSKTTGEPPICLALTASFALRNAVFSARAEIGDYEWIPLRHPFNVEEICLAANTKLEDLTI